MYLGSIDDCHEAEKALYTQTRIIKKQSFNLVKILSTKDDNSND